MSRTRGKVFEGAQERKGRSARGFGWEADGKQRQISVHSHGNV